MDRTGAIVWLCLPRFDSEACFAALLGTDDHGVWRFTPEGGVDAASRHYREGSLVLVTELDCAQGRIRITDAMPPRHASSRDEVDLVRVVEGVQGTVDVHMDLVLRFEYGSVAPWVTKSEHGIRAVAGPDALVIESQVPMHGRDLRTVSDFTLEPGEQVTYVMRWHRSHVDLETDPLDPDEEVDATVRWWQEWIGRSQYDGRWRDAVERSLLTLKALTYQPTGGIVAAPTTSLPEWIGGVRNWDYRYVWLRDATMTLTALLQAGYFDEACAWRGWLKRAAAGLASDLRIMYGVAGERRLTEETLPWLPGYEGSTPVRIGNEASTQKQLDIFGEVIDALDLARARGVPYDRDAWGLQRLLLQHLEEVWHEPDSGLWEVRGDLRHFTHSKVMAWTAFDRAVATLDRTDLDGPRERWRETAEEIREQVLTRAWDDELGSFTQAYGSSHLDAALLLLPRLGFLPPDDERVLGTISAIEGRLVHDEIFVDRYDGDDGIDCPEGAFLLCGFWLVDALALTGRRDEAVHRYERLLALRNDVGLLSEEWDPERGRMLGNFPQAFSHLGVITSAMILSGDEQDPHRGID